MGLDRLSYKRGALLIEASRILTPQFNPIAITLTGAQVELLRNATAVLHNESTFVSTYHDTYYRTATTADFDALSAIVADLEGRLMGNENTIFGYNDRLYLSVTHYKVTNGDYTLTVGTVPEGYVWVLNAMMSVNGNKTVTHHHRLVPDAIQIEVAIFIEQEASLWAINDRQHYTLKEGDSFRVKFEACDDGDMLIGRVWGYKMRVYS